MSLVRYNSPKPPIEVSLPVGAVSIFAGGQQPDGWLFCDGSAVSREDYSDLFSVIGDSYGAGDGATTFNLPNLASSVPVGKNNNDVDFANLGASGGSKTHQLTIDEMPSHTHTQDAHNHSGSTNNTGGHSHSGNTGNSGNHNHAYTKTNSGTRYVFNGNTSIQQAVVGSGNVGQGGDHDHNFNTNNAGSHSHNVSIDSATAVNQSTGGDSPHNNMPPYIVMNYIIKAVPELAAA